MEQAQFELTGRLQTILAEVEGAVAQEQWEAALTQQEAAVSCARRIRELNVAPRYLQQLGVMLFNLAQHYGRFERYEEAVGCLEEVVAIDEQTGHPDLESDRQALEAVRQQLAACSVPDPSLLPPQLASVLEQMSAAERAEIEQRVTQFETQLSHLSEDDQVALLDEMQRLAALPPEEQAAIKQRLIRGEDE